MSDNDSIARISEAVLADMAIAFEREDVQAEYAAWQQEHAAQVKTEV